MAAAGVVSSAGISDDSASCSFHSAGSSSIACPAEVACTAKEASTRSTPHATASRASKGDPASDGPSPTWQISNQALKSPTLAMKLCQS